MRIVWLCRWFGDYRIPVYKELNRLTQGEFYMIYSLDAVSLRVHEKMQMTLGKNALAMKKEKHLIIGNPKSDFANSHIDIPYQPGLFSAIKRVNPDIIISDGFFQWTFAALLKSRGKKLCIFYERTAYVERKCSGWRYKYRQFIGKHVDGFLINGSLTRDYLAQMGFSGKPKAEGCMVADSEGLQQAVKNCTENEKNKIRENLKIPVNGFIYLFIGQLVERKGIRQLLSAWELHTENYPQDHLIVLGEGVLRKDLEACYKRISSVHIQGAVDYDQIYQYYAIADVFVMPTLEDNWSLVIPEAMACGLPVATSIYNGCHVELIKNGKNGFVFDPLRKNDILRMLDAFHKTDLFEMGKYSIELVADYTPLQASKRIYELCKNIMK